MMQRLCSRRGGWSMDTTVAGMLDRQEFGSLQPLHQ